MECIEERIDLRTLDSEGIAESRRITECQFRLNQTMPMTEEYLQILKELFRENIGEGSYVAAPFTGVALYKLKIGRNVYINSNLLAMARGGITIEDDVQIAANVSLLSNNHDPYDRQILLCRPILIQKGAWIGANASILLGVSIGKHAIVGAGSVVTKDVPNYGVVVGNPAHVVKMLDPARFPED